METRILVDAGNVKAKDEEREKAETIAWIMSQLARMTDEQMRTYLELLRKEFGNPSQEQ